MLVAARFAAAVLLGLLSALALGSCGGDGEAIRTGTATLSLPAGSAPARTAPAVVETVTLTETAAAETVTLTDAAPPLPGADTETVTETDTVTETETVTLTETAPAGTETVTLTETAPAATTGEAPIETVTEAVTVTTTMGVSAAGAAAAAAAASEDDDGLTGTEWGWVLFGVLAAAVLIGGLVLWLRRRSAAKQGEGEGPPPADLTA